jgi:hypothetical protein
VLIDEVPQHGCGVSSMAFRLVRNPSEERFSVIGNDKLNKKHYAPQLEVQGTLRLNTYQEYLTPRPLESCCFYA